MDGGIAGWRKWLKDKSLLDDERMAKRLGLTMLEFNIAVKQFIIKGVTYSRSEYGRTELRGYDPGLTLTGKQRQEIDRIVTHRADDVARMLGITRYQFDKIKKHLGIEPDGVFGISFHARLYLYSQTTIKKMKPYADALKRGEKLPPPPSPPEPAPEMQFPNAIRARRGDRGLREACAEINNPAVGPTTLSRAEQGKSISPEAEAAIREWVKGKE